MIYATTELEAVNLLLSTIGEAPIESLDDVVGADVDMARQELHIVSRNVQARGWHFNTEDGIVLRPSHPDRFVYVPANTLNVDSVKYDRSRDVRQRGDRLYDQDNHTWRFEKEVTVDVRLQLPLDQLPEYARSYIVIKAARSFQQKTVGSGTLDRFTSDEENAARIALFRSEMNNQDVNWLRGGYQPRSTLRRR